MAEHLGWWSRQVKVFGRKSGATHMVSHATKTTEMLLQHWPTEKGPKHRAAREAVLEAMHHALDAKVKAKARTAFAAAAQEAGVGGEEH